MKNLSKPKYSIAAIKRKTKIGGVNSRVFDLVVAKKSKHDKLYVIEKLGSVDFNYNKFTINFFRLIFWIRVYPSINPKAWYFLNKYIFSKKW